MKYALITGASRGVGASSAKTSIHGISHYLCVARDEEKLKAVVAEIRDNSGEADYIPTDLMQDKDILKAGIDLYSTTTVLLRFVFLALAFRLINLSTIQHRIYADKKCK